ncbi:hypothetical protein GCM10007301_27990 [Azorhizobium oxalatiphilum]|uniref:Uncharacterized protein n=1 Tax=Azorhizobium oxalatiphilum TaxID=980631 RepID=A0A917C2C8_9HYPH|nr:hypothetical protein [Azorhizobium oxalatiphilum]GGF66724.1 hypothetical protein GCM10007301_27990 [Azorhizobium oxalatiphilum]
MSAAVAPSEAHEALDDEAFMSAEDLQKYMDQISLAKASRRSDALDGVEAARQELVKTLSEPVDLTPDRIAELKRTLAHKMRSAAERGQNEIMVMRFPNALCTDHGRTINNSAENWPESLTGRPCQAYEFWREHLQPAGFRLKAMIIEWPNGMPGDVGFFLSWS